MKSNRVFFVDKLKLQFKFGRAGCVQSSKVIIQILAKLVHLVLSNQFGYGIFRQEFHFLEDAFEYFSFFEEEKRSQGNSFFNIQTFSSLFRT